LAFFFLIFIYTRCSLGRSDGEFRALEITICTNALFAWSSSSHVAPLQKLSWF